MHSPATARPGCRPLQGLLFDLDGTLVDSEHLHFESTARVMATCGVTLERVHYDMYIGWEEHACWLSLNQRFGTDIDPALAAAERTQVYLELLRQRPLCLLPGVQALLDFAAASDLPMAVASSLPRAQIDAALASTGLADYFAVRRSGHDDVPLGRGKPAPDVYLAAAAALGVEAGHCLAFEDSPTGMQSARAAGCFVIGIPCPSHPTRDFSAADRVCASMTEALALLREHRA